MPLKEYKYSKELRLPDWLHSDPEPVLFTVKEQHISRLAIARFVEIKTQDVQSDHP